MSFGCSKSLSITNAITFRRLVYSTHIFPGCQRRGFSLSSRSRGEAQPDSTESFKEKTHSLTQAADHKKRLESSHEDSLREKAQLKFDLNSIFLLSIPITTHRSFIYCHHHAGLLNKSQIDAVPWIHKLEKKLVGFAVKGWDKLVSSDMTINKKIVVLVSKLLSSIPYKESCLRSFPSKETMVREVEEQSKSNLPKAVMTSELESKTVSLGQLKPIPVYHAKSQDPQTIIEQMNLFKTELVSYHKKWALLCALGIPITVPVALVPVVPNVPGFYLAYRLYCHLQALRGAKNLGFLLGDNDDVSSKRDTVGDSDHLVFQHHSDLDVFLTSEDLANAPKERMLINLENVDKIVEATGLTELKDNLYRAFKQESKRLKVLKEEEAN